MKQIVIMYNLYTVIVQFNEVFVYIILDKYIA